MSRPQVSIVQAWIPHYRAGFYQALHESLDREGVELRALTGVPVGREQGHHDLADLDWFEHLPNRAVRIGGREAWWQAGLGPTRGSDLVVVEQATKRLLNYPLLVRQRMGGPRVAMWGHGRTPTWVPPSGMAPVGALKTRMSLEAHWWFAYNDWSRQILEEMGYPSDRITNVQNSIDTNLLRAALREEVSAAPAEERRRALGIGSGPVAVYCGRLYAEKRVDFLLEAVQLIRDEIPDFEFIVIGDGPDEAKVQAAAADRPWIHPVGKKLGTDRVPYFAVADITLLPAFVGLSVVDSFAFEAPIVATKSVAHPPEVTYLTPDNGLWVDDGGDPVRYGKAAVELLRDPERLGRMKKGCAETAQDLTIEEMARRFHDGILAALEAPRR